MKFPLKTSLCAIALLAAAPAYADATIGTCVATDPDPDAMFCSAVAGNANKGAPGGTAAELNALLDNLDAQTPLDLGNANWAVVEGTKTFFSLTGGDVLNFAQTLFGMQVISIHFGNAGTGSGQGGETIMYLFDFGTAGRDWVDLNQQGFSNAVLITPPGSSPPVPEPATWGMVLIGFGAIGYAVRRRRKAFLPQVA